jgi:phosphatidylethanolamine/phosphatidyl-N-methylethanolamine N-methyltransferase
MPLKELSSLIVFGAEILRPGARVGAALPSSPILARRMAQFLPPRPSGYVVELGAGTGAITEALLDRGLSARRLFAVERSGAMSKHLRKKFPRLNVLTGDAAQLGELLPGKVNPDHISYIVSGLPLRWLDEDVTSAIMSEVRRLLPKNGRFIQFTYDLRRKRNAKLKGLELCESALVWRNLPPARVDVFKPV